MPKITTSSNLREFLLNSMEKVQSGKLTPERASIIIKGASQINESIYSELKANQLAKALGQEVKKFGALNLVEEAK